MAKTVEKLTLAEITKRALKIPTNTNSRLKSSLTLTVTCIIKIKERGRITNKKAKKCSVFVFIDYDPAIARLTA